MRFLLSTTKGLIDRTVWRTYWTQARSINHTPTAPFYGHKRSTNWYNTDLPYESTVLALYHSLWFVSTSHGQIKNDSQSSKTLFIKNGTEPKQPIHKIALVAFIIYFRFDTELDNGGPTMLYLPDWNMIHTVMGKMKFVAAVIIYCDYIKLWIEHPEYFLTVRKDECSNQNGTHDLFRPSWMHYRWQLTVLVNQLRHQNNFSSSIYCKLYIITDIYSTRLY